MDLGLERAGWDCRWQVEIDDWCQRVLAKHWPDVPRYGDVKEVTELEPVDLICGGFPCQPVSHAGRKLAQADDRWLWPEFNRIIRLVRPRYVLVENVPGLLVRGMGDVLGDLAESGYDAEWDCIPAAAIGAPHLRYRVWILAYRQDDAQCSDPNSLGPHQPEVHEHGGSQLRDQQDGLARSVGAEMADTCGSGLERQRVFGPTPERGGWGAEPDVGRVAPRTPDGVDRLRGLGNTVVPQNAEWIGRRLMEGAHG